GIQHAHRVVLVHGEAVVECGRRIRSRPSGYTGTEDGEIEIAVCNIDTDAVFKCRKCNAEPVLVEGIDLTVVVKVKILDPADPFADLVGVRINFFLCLEEAVGTIPEQRILRLPQDCLFDVTGIGCTHFLRQLGNLVAESTEVTGNVVGYSVNLATIAQHQFKALVFLVGTVYPTELAFADSRRDGRTNKDIGRLAGKVTERTVQPVIHETEVNADVQCRGRAPLQPQVRALHCDKARG